MYAQMYIMRKPASRRVALSLTQARAQLSPLVRRLTRHATENTVPISVRGEIKAYVVGAKHLEELEARALLSSSARRRPPTVRGTLEIVRKVEDRRDNPTPTLELELAALRSWDEASQS